jgi:hypothetical protein
MDPENQPAVKRAQPVLAELLSDFLHRQASAHQAGLSALDQARDVVPFESTPFQPTDPGLAWEHALTVVQYYAPAEGADRGALASLARRPPADWPALVAECEPMPALPFCVGNFPQLVREWHTLLGAPALREIQRAGGPPSSLPALQRWAGQVVHDQPYPYPLVAIGVLRLAKQFAGAAELLEHAEATDPGSWRDALANEAAALAWHNGRAEEAAALWESQPPTVAVLFNRGMAALFLDQPALARTWLEQAVSHLSDDNAWYHLGRLYLTLAELRS